MKNRDTSGVFHVVPVNDLREHDDIGDACWCKPRVEQQENGTVAVIHHALDGRDLVEKHGLQ